MHGLRRWSFGKVLLASAALFALSVALVACWIFFQTTRFFFDSSEGAGIGAVSIGINTGELAIPIVLPVVLIVAWLVARRSKSA